MFISDNKLLISNNKSGKQLPWNYQLSRNPKPVVAGSINWSGKGTIDLASVCCLEEELEFPRVKGFF